MWLKSSCSFSVIFITPAILLGFQDFNDLQSYEEHCCNRYIKGLKSPGSSNDHSKRAKPITIINNVLLCLKL